MRNQLRLLLILMLIVTARAGEPLKVFFIGNSLTMSNDLPGTIAALAKAGGKAFIYGSSLLPGRSLKEHWTDPKKRSVTAFEKGKWDYVVLQDYSSQPLTAPEDMVTYGKLFAEEIIRQGAQPAWFMTWAGAHNPKDTPVYVKAYSDLAAANGGLLIPVAVAWGSFTGKERQELFPGSDLKHPGPLGTYLTACVFYGSLFKASPVGLPGALDFDAENGKAAEIGKPSRIQVDPAKAETLQKAAWAAVQGIAPTDAKP
jgi:hypothetical protein